ncbi:hypothetical protein L1987_29864 [Smallanthus sonchifolius]|uniref:Uncharacterized protein n=1 Tax=Smallanthus sonchifolius TaxID=185202 RepID=A0ACB9I170_9ASTR|nr:hypothetical protein L1987_29864 [Smallanthus sonchifolius]
MAKFGHLLHEWRVAVKKEAKLTGKQTGTLVTLYDPDSDVSTSSRLQSWIKAKIHRETLVMGLPLYGWTWQSNDPSLYDIEAPTIDVEPGNEGTYWIGYDVKSVKLKIEYAESLNIGGYFFWVVNGNQEWKIS